MKLIELGEFEEPINCMKGDTIQLWIKGKKVHAVNIQGLSQLTHWACVSIAGGFGYFVGDARLEKELNGSVSNPTTSDN